MKLSTKANLLIVATVIVLFGPLSSLMLHLQERALRESAFNAVDGVAKSSVLRLGAFVENARQSVDALAASIRPQDLRGQPSAALLEQLGRMQETGNFGNGVFLLDAQGRFMADHPAHPELRGTTFAFRDYFIRTRDGRRGVMSEPYLSKRTGGPVLTFTAPVLDERNALVAVVACSYDLLDPNGLGAVCRQQIGQTGYSYLIDRDRLMILHPDPKRILKRDTPPGSNVMLDRSLMGFEGTGATVNSRGIPMLASYRSVPGTSWILGVQIPQSEAFTPIESSRRMMRLATLLSLLLILTAGTLAVRHFTRPLGDLHHAARTLTLGLEGGGTGADVLPVLDAIRSSDEIGTLARTFRDLVVRQQQSLGMLRQAASEWELTFDAVNEAILCLDEAGRVVRINRLAADWFRIAPAAALGLDGRTLMFGEGQRSGFWPAIGELDAGHPRTWTDALPGQGGTFEFRASPVLLDGTARGMVLVVRDVTEQVRQEESIRRQAFFDALTGLPNRTLLMDRLQQALAASARTGRGLAVLFLDLDRFKAVNDAHGHEAGDALLQEAARRLAALTRRNDTVARLGGDEFVMILTEIPGREAARALAAKVVASLAAPFRVAGLELEVGTSVGIAYAPADGDDGPTLLKNADTAMYQAKRAGRSAYREFSEPS